VDLKPNKLTLIIYLRIIMENKMSFADYRDFVDVTAGKTLAMLGIVKILSSVYMCNLNIIGGSVF
jgi:hypothetical protein